MSEGTKVCVTGSTGMAAINISSQGCQATTVHALADPLDGCSSKEHLKSHVRTDEAWEETRREVSTCQTIVDETSMLSSRTFEHIRNNFLFS